MDMIPAFHRRPFAHQFLIAVSFLFAAAGPVTAAGTSLVVGDVRVQALSASLVRIELKGREGFEDRQTFHVVNRDWPGTAMGVRTNRDVVEIHTSGYVVHVPQSAASLANVSVTSPDGAELYRGGGPLQNSVWLPAPGSLPPAWWFADTPRIVPPAWGLTPPPAPMTNGGWDLNNDAPDVYVFVPGGDYRQLRKDFLKLTGPTEMPPLFMFGAFDSRWYDYSEATALQQIEAYRTRKIPLDVLVVDTGWRAGASTGYHANTNLFPNLPRFFAEAHAKNVRVMFNDHPEPLSTNAPSLNAAELHFRFNGLAGLLRDGLDVWWYDRNWWVALVPPAPNLRKEAWGMRLYHDTTLRVRPDQRPLIMANVDGIDNGLRHRPMDVSAHRFPFQWTGDIGPGWPFLRRAVENAVYSGAQSLFPYESDDLGGHIANPTTEQYIRWIEYGALSPVYRPHCTHGLERMPWAFGPVAEATARDFINLRYRLLPVFYAAAHENYETGEPLLRRLDLEFPRFSEARRNDEYLLGRNLLVAPVLQGSLEIVPAGWLKTAGGRPGLTGRYFTNDNLSGTAQLTRTDSVIDFNWNDAGPAPEIPRTHFSAVWSGTIEVPAQIGDVRLGTLEDDGVRVWIDGQPVIDAWGGHDSATTEASAVLTAGVPHQLRIEYQQLDYGAALKLEWEPAQTLATGRMLWIPPGDWINAWDGQIISGPVNVTNSVPLRQIPLFIRSGAVLPLAPEMQFTGEKPWSPLLLDVYPRAGATNAATLYEDDTISIAYQHGEFRTTLIQSSADTASRSVRVTIGAARGTYRGALRTRAWTLRLHSPAGWPENLVPTEVRVNGKTLSQPIRRLARVETALPLGDPTGAPDGAVFEINLPASSVQAGQAMQITFSPER